MFRPWFGRVLTVAISVVCAVTLVAAVVSAGPSAVWLAGPWLALVAGSCWALFWRPHVVVEDGGVQLINVLRTIELPWPAIQAVDTKWALTLITAYGRFTAWAAPAPGGGHALRASRGDTAHLPASTYARGGIRAGDLPSSPSGQAALVIRRRWEQLRDAGYLDAARLERERATVRWHWSTIGGGAALTLLGVVTLLA